MSEFKKGQLVAVSDCEGAGGWHFRVYIRTSSSGHHLCRRLEALFGPSEWWKHAKPAEEVWPGLFFDRDSDNLSHMRRMRQDMGMKRRQIQWLCLQLEAIGDRNGTQECPPPPHQDCRRGNCADCWKLASLEAVKEKPCP